jgi:hypothetical protein
MPGGLTSPDLKAGIATADLDGGMLVGHADGEPVLVTRRDSELFAIGAALRGAAGGGGPHTDPME